MNEKYNAKVVANSSRRYRYLFEQIFEYFEKRGLKWPTTDQALKWAHTESGEVAELLLARDGGWVRNNPGDHSEYADERLIEEIGDQVFMLLVAGMVMKWDVLEAMQCKMERILHDI